MPAGWGGRSDQQGRPSAHRWPRLCCLLGLSRAQGQDCCGKTSQSRSWACFVWGGRPWVEGHSGDAWAACGLVPPWPYSLR